MKPYKFIISTLLLSLYFLSNCQTSIQFNSLILNDTTTEMKEHIVHDDTHFFLLNSKNKITGDYKNEIVLTNKKFNIITSLEESDNNNFIFNASSFFEILDNELYLLSNGNLDGKNYLITHKYSLDLKNHEIIDSLDIGENYFVTFAKNGFKQDIDNNGYITFGNLFNLITESFSPIHFMKFDNKFKFVELIQIDDTFKAVHETIVLNESREYLIGSWINSMFLLDENLNFVDTLFESNGFTHNFCEETENNQVSCLAYLRSSDEFAITRNEYNISNNKIELVGRTPLNNSDSIVVDERIHQMLAIRDKENNINIVYAENWTPNEQDFPGNSMYFKKFDSQDNIIIDRKIEGGDGQFVLSTINEDEENNIIITGFYYPKENTFNSRFNFYMIIDQFGEILTSTKSLIVNNNLNIYPNPTQGNLVFNIKEINNSSQYEIYTVDGKFVKSGIVDSSTNINLNVSELINGMYILRVISEQNMYTGKFIKG